MRTLIQCAPKLKYVLALIIQCASSLKDSFQSTLFSAHFLLFRKFRRRKSTQIALEFIFLVSQKFVIYKLLNTLKVLWFTIDSSVLLNQGFQFFFHILCLFSFMTSLNISVHLSIKTILVDPYLVRTFLGKIFFDPNYGAHPQK